MVKPKSDFFSRGPGLVSQALHNVVSQIPTSAEPAATDPQRRANELAKTAAMKAAALSGSFSLPFGPLGLATVIPDLLAVWRIQQQLVADIAATYGKTAALTQETMALCLFQHGGAALMQHFSQRAGDDIVIQRIATRTLQQLLEKIAIRLTQRLAAKSVSRWVPILGALGAGAYAYYDTTHVAANAIELFAKSVRIEIAPPAGETDPVSAPEAGTTPGSRATSRPDPPEPEAEPASANKKSARKSVARPASRKSPSARKSRRKSAG